MSNQMLHANPPWISSMLHAFNNFATRKSPCRCFRCVTTIAQSSIATHVLESRCEDAMQQQAAVHKLEQKQQEVYTEGIADSCDKTS